MQKFIALFDLHWGYERRGGHKVALHDVKALKVALGFMADFKPDHVILGGDILDCGAISHHNSRKPGAVEGLRIRTDAVELRKALIEPLEAVRPSTMTYIEGNHEDWLNDLTEANPALEGLVDVRAMLGLGVGWKVVPCGEAHTLGKVVFIHGDQIRSGINSAKAAVEAYQRNVFFGHYHTHQVYTKVSALDTNGHTGTVVPCLCKKNPRYGGGSPNRWMQGFLYGYIDTDQSFNAYVVIIINGKAVVNGKVYKG